MLRLFGFSLALLLLLPNYAASSPSNPSQDVDRQSSYPAYLLLAAVKQLAQGVYTSHTQPPGQVASASRRIAATELLLAGWVLIDLLFSYLLPYGCQQHCQRPARYTYPFQPRHILFKLLLLGVALLGGAGIWGYGLGSLVGVIGVVTTQLLLALLLVGNSRSNHTKEFFDLPNYCSKDCNLTEKIAPYPAAILAHHQFFERLYNGVALIKIAIQSGLLLGWFFLGSGKLPRLLIAACCSAELFLVFVILSDLSLRTQLSFSCCKKEQGRWLCWQLKQNFLGSSPRLQTKNIWVAILKVVLGLIALWSTALLYKLIQDKKSSRWRKSSLFPYGLILLHTNSVGLLLFGFLENLENYRCCQPKGFKKAVKAEKSEPLSYPFADESLSLELFTKEEQLLAVQGISRVKSESRLPQSFSPVVEKKSKVWHYKV